MDTIANLYLTFLVILSILWTGASIVCRAERVLAPQVIRVVRSARPYRRSPR